MKRKFEVVFESVDFDNWEDAVTEAEDFIRNVKNKFDEQILYMFFEDCVTAGEPHRLLLYTYSCEVPNEVKNLLRAFTKIARFLTVEEKAETDFVNSKEYGAVDVAYPITEDEIEYLMRLSKVLNFSSLNFLSNLDLFIFENDCIMQGIKEYFAHYIPLEKSDDSSAEDQGYDDDDNKEGEDEERSRTQEDPSAITEPFCV